MVHHKKMWDASKGGNDVGKSIVFIINQVTAYFGIYIFCGAKNKVGSLTNGGNVGHHCILKYEGL